MAIFMGVSLCVCGGGGIFRGVSLCVWGGGGGI